MGAVQDAKVALAAMNRNKGETDEEFAKRLYYRQMEVYSSWAGRDLVEPYESLNATAREGWVYAARTHNT